LEPKGRGRKLVLIILQAIVVPVNNWLEPNVGDGKQQVCHTLCLLLSKSSKLWYPIIPAHLSTPSIICCHGM